MTDRPIIFSGPMVRALLAGRKTQTRRIIKLPPAPDRLGEWQVSTVGGADVLDGAGNPTPEWPCVWHTRTGAVIVPRHAAGDRLYVREAAAVASIFTDVVEVRYKASERAGHTEFAEQVPVALANGEKATWPRYRPSIHMPRWASRLTLTVDDVRVERLNDISEADAIAEGIESYGYGSLWGWIDYAEANPGMTRCFADPRRSFQSLWESLHGADSWAANPWVAAVSFRVKRGNIDQVASDHEGVTAPRGAV